MDRQRISEEVIEILCNKLPQLPLPNEDPKFDYAGQRLVPEITDNDLDIAEVIMDLEDAFDIVFDAPSPGSEGMETIGDIISFIEQRLAEYEAERSA